MVEYQDVGSPGPQNPGECRDQGTGVPELSDGQALAVEVGASLSQAVQLPYLCDRGPTDCPTQELAESKDGLGSGDAIDRQADVPLEVAECPGRVRAEDPVDPTSIESEAAEAELEVGHVVAPKHRSVQVEMTIPEPDPCLHEGSLGGLVDRAVFVQAALGLEGQKRPGRVRSEVTVGLLDGVDRMADRQQAAVEVPDGSPPVVGSNRLGHWPNRRVARSPRGSRPVPRATGPCPWRPPCASRARHRRTG